MAPLVFKPDRSRSGARRLFGGILAFGGVLGRLILPAGLCLTPAFLEGAETTRGALWGSTIMPFGYLRSEKVMLFLLANTTARCLACGTNQKVPR